MGQSGSAQLETVPRSPPVERKPLPVKKLPPPRPASPPKRPRSPPKEPKYKVPENRVLPVALGDLSKRNLRPISQEISKVYPEFADLFHKRDPEDDDEYVSADEAMDTSEYGYKTDENMEKSGDHQNGDVRENGTFEKQNGHIPNGTPTAFTRSMSTDESSQQTHIEANLRRSHSLDRQPMKKGHRRQPSRTTSLMNEEHTIFEDPRETLAENREHLYDEWKKDPYTNAPSNVVSLPVKTNFSIDVNYNMTYAQLAEHRRQKNLEDLQKKTGINVDSLHSDLSENSNDIFNPFQRQPLRESTRSTSTASSDTGVSKRKKKRAPPPPGAKVDTTADEEPPIDYDMDDVPMPAFKTHQRRMSTTSALSNMSTKTKQAPPPPPVNAASDVTKSPKNPEVPSSTDLPSESVSSSATGTSQAIPIPPPPPSSDIASQEQKAIHQLDQLLAEKTISAKSGNERERKLSVQSESEDDSEKVRVLKGKIPPLNFEKPKDESQLFREKLAQAYEERTKRREAELKKKEEEERKLKEKIAEQKRKEEEEDKEQLSARSEKKHGESVEILRRMSRDLDKKWLSAHRSQSPEVTSAHETDDELSSKEGKSPGHRRVFSEDWTPEHDLDSDDDIEDRNMYSHQRSTSEGFRSSMVPTKFNEFKKGSKGSKKYIRKQSDSSNEEKNKYGSIRKLKKTVHKGVKNAFGSISRASGKLLRKQRSIDLDIDDAAPPPPPPSNWHLSASTQNLNAEAKGERRHSHDSHLTSDEDDSESEYEDAQTHREPVPSINGSSKPEINGHAEPQVSLLPNGSIETDRSEDNSRLYKKKKKKNGVAQNGRAEVDTLKSSVNERIEEKKRQIELERVRQIEIERDMLRLQALEDEERRQRLHTAHFQQQLQILQQSVGPTASALSAPPLPPAGGMHSYSVPDFRTHSPHLYPHMMNPGIPQSPLQSGMSFGSGTPAPNLTSFDINYLSNLMRMNGVQPPSSSQQWAYLLGSVSLPGQPATGKSMYPGADLSANARQVKSMYVTTSGPDLTKMFQGQSFDDSQLRTSKVNMMDYLTSRKQSQSYSNLTDHHQRDPAQINTLLHEYERSASMNGSTFTEKPKERSNPMYYSSDEEELTAGLSPARTSRSYVASVNVKDYRTMPTLHTDGYGAGGDGRGTTYAAYHVQSSPSHRQRFPGEDSSSSGADR